MKQNKISIEIQRPIADVFDFTINPNNTHLWIDSVIKEETSEWPIKIGTEYRNVDTKGEWTTYIVSALESNKLFELKQKGGDYSVRYTYEKVSDLMTRLTYFEWMEKGELSNPFQQGVLEKLKQVMESKKFWFKNKRYGYGWVPATWQGWSSMLVYVFLLVLIFIRIDTGSHSGSDTLISFAIPFIILSTLFIALCYWKGEKPKWQWGKDRK